MAFGKYRTSNDGPMNAIPKPHPAFALHRPQAVKEKLIPDSKMRLKAQFNEVCRFKHLAMRPEESYWFWVVRLVRHFGSKIHPRNLTAEELRGFLSHLATVGQVAASIQNQALNALLFLYREVLHQEQVIVNGSKRVSSYE